MLKATRASRARAQVAGSLLAAWGRDGVDALKRMSEHGHLILKGTNFE